MKVEPITDERWRTCCHEAAHAHAARILLEDPRNGAVVFADGGGVALVNVSEPLSDFESAIVLAAGPEAEILATRIPPPSVNHAKPITPQSGYAGLCEDLEREASGTPTDLQRLVEYVKRVKPSRRRTLIRSICAHARGLINQNAGAIVKTAHELYLTGTAILKKGKEQ